MCHFLPVYHLGIAFLGWVEGQNITQDHWQTLYPLDQWAGIDDHIFYGHIMIIFNGHKQPRCDKKNIKSECFAILITNYPFFLAYTFFWLFICHKSFSIIAWKLPQLLLIGKLDWNMFYSLWNLVNLRLLCQLLAIFRLTLHFCFLLLYYNIILISNWKKFTTVVISLGQSSKSYFNENTHYNLPFLLKNHSKIVIITFMTSFSFILFLLHFHIAIFFYSVFQFLDASNSIMVSEQINKQP